MMNNFAMTRMMLCSILFCFINLSSTNASQFTQQQRRNRGTAAAFSTLGFVDQKQPKSKNINTNTKKMRNKSEGTQKATWNFSTSSSPSWSSMTLAPSTLSSQEVDQNLKSDASDFLTTKEEDTFQRTFMKKLSDFAVSFREAYGARKEFMKLGMHALLSYTIVANMFVIGQFVMSWYIFSTKTGMTPLAPGQWKGFLATYAKFAAVSATLLPLLKVALAKCFLGATCRLFDASQRQFKTSNSAATMSYLLVIVNVAMIPFIGVGVLGASAISGVPVFGA